MEKSGPNVVTKFSNQEKYPFSKNNLFGQE
jgi:hypothetical protein